MKITVTAVTAIPSGVALRLTPEQASSRSHAIEPYGKQKHVYVGTQQLTFKAGEVIEVVGDLPKGILPIYDQVHEKSSQSGDIDGSVANSAVDEVGE